MSETSPGQRGSFAAVTALFFTMGFITSVIDPLIPSVKAVFKLNYAELMLTQFTYFLSVRICLAARRLACREAGLLKIHHTGACSHVRGVPDHARGREF